MMNVFTLTIAILFSSTAVAQSNLDSLWRVWNDPTKPDTARLIALHDFTVRGYMYTKPDSAAYFGQLELDFARSRNLEVYVAKAHTTRAVSFSVGGRYDEALFHFSQVLDIGEKLGDHQTKASCLNNIGNVFVAKNELDSALTYYLRALEINEKFGNKKILAVALNNLGVIYYYQSDFARAEDYFSRSLTFNKEINDPSGISSNLNHLGSIYWLEGNYESAIRIYLQSLKLSRDLGDHAQAASTLGNIGNIYRDKGDYIKALEYQTESLKILQTIDIKTGMANSLLNIGNTYYSQSDYGRAMEHYLRGLEIYELTGDQRGISKALGNIGVVHNSQGNHAKAIEYYNRSAEIMKASGDKMGMAKAFDDIGRIYLHEGDYQNAKALHEQSRKINEEIDFKSGTSLSMSNLSLVLRAEGDYQSAIDMSRKALDIALEIGKSEAIYESYVQLFKCYRDIDSLSRAEHFLNCAMANAKANLTTNFPFFTEEQKELYLTGRTSIYDMYNDFAHMSEGSDEDICEGAFDNALLVKGLLLKSSTATRQSILSSDDSLLIKQYYDWISLKRRIAKIYSDGGDAHQLEERAHELEMELVKKSTAFSDIQKMQERTWKDVQAGLKKGEIAIEFIRFSHQPDPRIDSVKKELYSALIIGPDIHRPQLVHLFEETELEKLLGVFPGNNLAYVEQVYGSSQNKNAQLYTCIWKPLEEFLTRAKKVYVSPVGLLHKISFSAITNEQGSYLSEIFDVEIVASTGELDPDNNDGPSATFDRTSFAATIFGGIDYNSDSTTTEVWKYLEGSLSETQQIAKLLQTNEQIVNYYNHANASELQFKQTAPGSGIIHIATHGFFYPDLEKVTAENVIHSETEIKFRGDGAIPATGKTPGFGIQQFVKSKNPLRRSGLVFAGANDVWSRKNSPNDSTYLEDGVLTAQEVATIDMRNTELVVLSACETGLGDIKGSEGVYGLQRAFKMAGVKYIIMSLWQVPDKETAEFMTTFYKYLTNNNDIRKSFNLTQQIMRKKYDPYYWGAFVLVE